MPKVVGRGSSVRIPPRTRIFLSACEFFLRIFVPIEIIFCCLFVMEWFLTHRGPTGLSGWNIRPWMPKVVDSNPPVGVNFSRFIRNFSRKLLPKKKKFSVVNWFIPNYQIYWWFITIRYILIIATFHARSWTHFTRDCLHNQSADLLCSFYFFKQKYIRKQEYNT